MNANEMKAVEQIKKQYEEKTPDQLEELKKLDRKIKLPAYVFAYIFGSIGALVLGAGMCIAMEVILPGMMALGIVIGLVGIAMVSATYPIHQAILRSARKKNAARMIELSDSLLGRYNSETHHTMAD